MSIKTILAATALAILLLSCGKRHTTTDILESGKSLTANTVGDKTIYGLACDGCTDSVLVLLPDKGGDPVKYDIIDAFHDGKILGKPKIGDWVGVIRSQEDSMTATMVVDIDELKGIWCYIVMPQMRDFSHMSQKLQRRLMNQMSDSIKETHLIPREYGFWLKSNWIAQSVGYVPAQSALEEESPVVYPPLGYFTTWQMWNGMLIVTSATPTLTKDGKITITNPVNDTCNIDYLKNDSLVLSDRFGSRGYYRKKNVNDVNKKAIKIANALKSQALKQTTE